MSKAASREPGARLHILAQVTLREMEDDVRRIGGERGLDWSELPEWMRPKRIWLARRPGYWGWRHFKQARKASEVFRMSYAHASETLDAFFGPSEEWCAVGGIPKAVPLYRTDSQGVWGPDIDNLLATAKVGGWHFLQFCREYLRNYASRSHNGHLGEEWFWSRGELEYIPEKGYRLTGKITGGMSRRHWSKWKLCFHLQNWGVLTRKVPWSVLKGVDRLSGRSFLIARAMLRSATYHGQRISAEEFFKTLSAYIRGERDVAELVPAMARGDTWRIFHGRVPRNENVRNISKELIAALKEKNRMKSFLRLLADNEEISEHDAEAAARLCVCFGSWAADFIKKSGLSLHDAGINLPTRELGPEQVKFLFRYAHKAAEACRVVGAWETVRNDFGIDPLAKGGLEAALAALATLVYEGARHGEFARVAAECGVGEYGYHNYETLWLNALEDLTHQSVPAPAPLQDGELRLSQLRKEDPRAVFAGVYTGCCQHPGGAGRSCAEHAHGSPDGAVWAVELRGKIVAQAWVWRHKDVLVLDSVEASVSVGEDSRERIKVLFQRAAESVLGKFCVTHVYVGTGYGGIHWRELESVRRPFGAPTSYDDSGNVWLIAERAPVEMVQVMKMAA